MFCFVTKLTLLCCDVKYVTEMLWNILNSYNGPEAGSVRCCKALNGMLA